MGLGAGVRHVKVAGVERTRTGLTDSTDKPADGLVRATQALSRQRERALMPAPR